MRLGLILGTGFDLDGAIDAGAGRRTVTIGGIEILAIHRQPQPVPPHKVDYVSTMRTFLEFGADLLVTTTACGSLAPEIAPGSLVVPDDMVDLSLFAGSMIQDEIIHPAANPVYDAKLRQALCDGFDVAEPCDRGTIVSIRGPRFATKAESLFYQAQGWSYINMTTAQETMLALESAVPVAVLGHVTDFDSGVPEVGDPSDLGLIRERMASGNKAFNERFPRFVERLA